MTVRHAQTGDMPTIIELLEQELGYPQERLVQTNARLQRILSHPDYSTFVALNESTVVGFIGLMRCIAYEFEGDYLRIAAVAVRQEEQGCGVGGLLLEHAERFARAAGFSCLAVNSGLSRLPAHAFYEKQGFVKKGYGYAKRLRP